jgi:hypothetical protein
MNSFFSARMYAISDSSARDVALLEFEAKRHRLHADMMDACAAVPRSNVSTSIRRTSRDSWRNALSNSSACPYMRRTWRRRMFKNAFIQDSHST